VCLVDRFRLLFLAEVFFTFGSGWVFSKSAVAALYRAEAADGYRAVREDGADLQFSPHRLHHALECADVHIGAALDARDFGLPDAELLGRLRHAAG